MKRKTAIFLVLITMLLTCAVALSACGDDDTVYKNGTVTEVIGSARVHRNGGSMPAYKGLLLKHGDRISTEAGNSVAIAVEGDKYALIEGDSQVTLMLYENSDENVALFAVSRGAVYIEADTPVAEGLIFGVITDDVTVSGGEATYRVEVTPSNGGTPRMTLAQAIKGGVSVMALNSEYEQIKLAEGFKCRVDRYMGESDVGPFFARKDESIDPYELPDRYIEVGEDGVFDAAGAVIPKLPSGDLSLKGITVVDAEGNVAPLSPEFSNDIPVYVVQMESPFSLTVSANHKKASLRVQCMSALSVDVSGNKGTVYFDTEKATGAFTVSIQVTAENGDTARFSVTVIRAEAEE